MLILAFLLLEITKIILLRHSDDTIQISQMGHRRAIEMVNKEFYKRNPLHYHNRRRLSPEIIELKHGNVKTIQRKMKQKIPEPGEQ